MFEETYNEDAKFLDIPAECNRAVDILQRSRNNLIRLQEDKPLEEDVDVDDDNYPLMEEAFDELNEAIKALTKAQSKFMEVV